MQVHPEYFGYQRPPMEYQPGLQPPTDLFSQAAAAPATYSNLTPVYGYAQSAPPQSLMQYSQNLQTNVINVGAQQPPPPVHQSLPPPPYQTQATGYGLKQDAAAPPIYSNLPSPAYGYTQPVPPQPQMQNNPNVLVNVINAGAPQPIIITQQAVVVPPSYLGWSIFNCLCCFWPLGLAAIIYSVKVGSSRSPEEARSYSITARNLNISATVIAPLLVVLIVGSVMGAASGGVVASSRNQGSSSYNSYLATVYYYSYFESYSYLSTYSYYTYYSYYNNMYMITTYNFYLTYGYQYVTGYQYTQGSYYYYYYG